MKCSKNERQNEASLQVSRERFDKNKRAFDKGTALSIGGVILDNPYILGPMAGVTDLPFRLLCKEQGAGLLCMEMISAKALYYNNKNTVELLKIDPRECPVSLQLFGSEPEIISEMAKKIEHLPFSILDINMGCPVPKIVGNGEGSALMKDPKLVGRILRETVKAINKPVTVKIRKGFDEDHINAVEIAKIAEDAGVSAIAVHGRTREQYYTGTADWNIIGEVAQAVSIPVIGSGDVVDPISAHKMMEETGCQGVMIARGAQGNPWIFNQLLHYDATGQVLRKPTVEDVRKMVLRHGKLLMEVKGEYTGMREMRKHGAWYTKGYPNSAHIRGRLNEVETYAQLVELFN